ncbi:hypothetical protein GS440_16240 [Rhodococcus hoagii]|nr:hypothetical protein [Prescottella equi]
MLRRTRVQRRKLGK